MSLYCHDSSFVDSFKLGNYSSSLEELQQCLVDNKIAFDFNSKRGVMLINPSNTVYAQAAIIGNSHEDVQSIKEKFLRLYI